MEYWLWLKELKGLGNSIEQRLLAFFKSPKAIYEAEELDLMEVEGVGKTLAKSIRQEKSLNEAFKILEKVEKNDIKILTYHDPLYPVAVKESKYAPTLLYYKGKIRESSMGVAIVGSRRCSQYGKEVAIEASTFLAENNIPVISGMAKGIDGYAHIATLKSKGYTMAFLGHGLNCCYPKEHGELMEAIIDKGAVLSEYPPDRKPRPEYFPKRNRLFISWSRKVLIVEAGEKSGTLLTAKLAKEDGKEILVLPHEIYNPSGKGGNQLISDGATVYLKLEQLLIDREEQEQKRQFLCVKKQTQKKSSLGANQLSGDAGRSPTEIAIIKSLNKSDKSIQELERATGLSQIQLLEYIAVLELEGVIDSIGGRFRVIR
ncbi:DNA recombination mediator protein A [Clostridium aceticum]|uniref:DNA recombination mediator protein A n=1 Tax=Clostridium aceticum TaxID=84022 RepID=A0A0D8I6B0_9CLOT|nr:DNA-processing protein DprA [Clostridium aceticum]AKL93675.1 DNA recombination mediator protein A [Clostridium aceticum]KJF25589.1 hypothetical protein TZ02_17780 [Clostridium aceticum]